MIRIRSLVEPSLEDSIIHRMDPRVKIVLIISVSMLVISLDNPWALLCVALSTLILYPIAKLPWSKIRALLLLLLPIIWGIMIAQALFYHQFPRTVMFTLIPPDFPILGKLTNGLHVYEEGWLYGAKQSLRFISELAIGLLAVWTTDSQVLLRGLTQLRIPYTIAFMLITGIRFIPILISETMTVVVVQRLKAFNPLRIGFRSVIKTLLFTSVPILANCVRRSRTLAISVESRAFRSGEKRTYLREEKLRAWEFLFIAILIILPIMIIIAKILYGLYINEVYYNADLRILYAFVRNYL